jgi:hypothetical protein
MLGYGATGGTLLTLVTEESVFVTLPADLIGQIGTYCFIHRQLLLSLFSYGQLTIIATFASL